MRMNAIVAGVGMSRFGKHVDTGLKALGAEVVQAALTDSGLAAADIEAATSATQWRVSSPDRNASVAR